MAGWVIGLIRAITPLSDLEYKDKRAFWSALIMAGRALIHGQECMPWLGIFREPRGGLVPAYDKAVAK